MSMFNLIFFSWVLLALSYSVFLCCGSSCCPQQIFQQSGRPFEQKTDRFWEFREQTNTWVEVELPYDLVSCVNDNCSKVGLIDHRITRTKEEEKESLRNKDGIGIGDGDGGEVFGESSDVVLPLRKRISLTRMSETSFWITGVSGSVYERFWNGVQWVIAPHDLPVSAGPAVSVFIVNQTILALSEAGVLYQMQLGENSQPLWVEFIPAIDQTTNKESELIQIKSGVVSYDGERVYFCTKNGLLLELSEVEPPRWVNHGRPPGANVAAIADAAGIRPEAVYTISSTGDLYEYDRTSKPSWKKHIWSKGTAGNASLIPSMGCTVYGLIGDHSISLFLLTKGGKLVERRIQQRKWKWIVHGSPKDHHLTSITPVLQDESNENFFPLFFTTSVGTVFEYRISKHSGTAQEKQILEGWTSHMHPPQAKAARGVAGLPFQIGRILFPLDDGRLGELHLSGLGGENSGPNNQVNVRRKALIKYVWSILDAPETEGWNAEYCTEERGPMNCITGIKDEPNDSGLKRMTRRRKGSPAHHDYVFPKFISRLLIRERSSTELSWINCTAMRKGKQVIGGPPWDGMTGKAMKVTAEDALFFVSKNGRLLQFTVALRKFKWKDCRHPPQTKVACIVDQELFRDNIVFVVGRNGRLYQYNKVTGLWHEHYQSQHLILSVVPGTAMRPSSASLTGSLFMLSQDGGLVEYHWNSWDGWNWVEHGTPDKDVTLVGAPGPCFEGNQLFLIGSDGKVYLRYMAQMTWRWKNCGFPCMGKKNADDQGQVEAKYTMEEVCPDKDEDLSDHNKNCDPKGMHVAATRPVSFSEYSMIFELRDGRLAEMQRVEDTNWVWLRTIATPTSVCFANYWTALAS
ncbi:hypothetical protein Patl1_29541 [Pistacia atlantica]|uniref:Uncharacterized protein n=1 Tax=Pistacia atlantica TaxID=434234 RepID=A0ACC1ACZ2_9ROSI|nr:hypothetical protein Patl1_29541 [Pistacia atlantica]